MSLFLLKRLATLIGTLIGASVIVFLVLEILPGNAAQLLMGPDAAPEAVAALATKLGLDQPAWTRYWHWIGGILTGNLGDSYAYSSPSSSSDSRSPCRLLCWRWRLPPCSRCWSA